MIYHIIYRIALQFFLWDENNIFWIELDSITEYRDRKRLHSSNKSTSIAHLVSWKNPQYSK